MLKATLESTLYAAGRRGVWLPSIVGTLALEGVLRLAGWPATSFGALSPVAIAVIVFVLCLLYWLSVSVMAAALSVLRGGSDSVIENWVEPATAFRAAIVTAMAAVPVMIGSLAIFPGLYLGAMWAPITMIVVDGRHSVAAGDDNLVMASYGGLFDTFELSSLLTKGARVDVSLIFVVLGFLFAGVEWFDSWLGAIAAETAAASLVAVVHLLLKAAFDTLSLCFLAALYFELEARAFVDSVHEPAQGEK